MDETKSDLDMTQIDPPRLYTHDDCEKCPTQKVSTSHLGYTSKTVLDAVGNIVLTLSRAEGGLGLWDGQMMVYSIDTPPGGMWEIEHWATAGVPTYMPPNCPEWLWVAYTLLGDMCSHFMDLHDVTANSDLSGEITVDPQRG
jgi:hypothetical protein